MFVYLASKHAAEQVIADSALPWTTLRATQFHDLLRMVAQQLARLPVVPVPAGWRFQPVDLGDQQWLATSHRPTSLPRWTQRTP